MRPSSATPFFVLCALAHLLAIASRFPEIAAALPEYASTWILFAHGPLLLLAGYFEGLLHYPEQSVKLPAWMLITSRPVKWSFTFAFIYLTLVVAETWDISLRGIRPIGPEEWPLQTRALFFVGFTVGLSFFYYLQATKLLIPLLRVLSWPARKFPRAVGLPLALVLGAVLGLALLHAVSGTAVDDTASVVDALVAAPNRIVVLSLGGLAGLAAIGALFLRTDG